VRFLRCRAHRKRRARGGTSASPKPPTPPTPAPPGALRIAVTLPGGVTFGTVEAGAVCALVVAVQQMQSKPGIPPCIDVIAGSSAGALSGVLAAHTLMWGEDPVPVFRRAWVSEPSLAGLLGTGRAAPLSLRRARAIADDLLAGRVAHDVAPRQAADVTLVATLGCLRGLSYKIVRWPEGVEARRAAEATGGAAEGPDAEAEIEADRPGTLRATSYLDWAQHTLAPIPKEGQPDADQGRAWPDAVDAAMASASHPAAFAPELLRRERAVYNRNGVALSLARNADKGVGDPADVRLWYTDGGLVDNQPLGRCLKVVAELDRTPTEASPPSDPTEPDPKRLVLLVRSGVDRVPPRNDPAWSGGRRPRWTETLQRALGLLAAHNVGEDLRHLEKVNTRIERSAQLAELLATFVRKHSVKDGEKALKSGLESDLAKFLEDIESDREHLPRHRPDVSYALEGDKRPELSDLLRAALFAASGLQSKRRVDVSIVEPASERTQIRGHGFLRFGGFLDRRRREYDFAVGYWSMVDWMAKDERFAAAANAVGSRVRRPQPAGKRAWSSRRVRLRTRLLLGRLGARVVTIGVSDAIAIRRRKKVD
jgi:predicted acylesterase/phospholipase RssA